mgnify:CR=1 FL=1|jgi:hypothetical protein
MKICSLWISDFPPNRTLADEGMMCSGGVRLIISSLPRYYKHDYFYCTKHVTFLDEENKTQIIYISTYVSATLTVPVPQPEFSLGFVAMPALVVT